MSVVSQDLFAVIDRAWDRLATSSEGADALARWCEDQPVLCGPDGLSQLLAALRGASDPELRDERLRAMLRIAAADPTAATVVLQVIRPGLWRLARSYERRWGREDASSIVVLAALERIATFPVEARRANLAAHLVRDIGRGLFRTMQREASLEAALGQRLDLEEAVSVPALRAVTSAEQVLGIVNDAVTSGRLSRRHGRLIVKHRVLGYSTAEIAEAEGRSRVAVRTMRARAEASLASAVAVA